MSNAQSVHLTWTYASNEKVYTLCLNRVGRNTQFLNGAATLPDSQKPATSFKEDAPAASTGESEEANHENSF